MRIRTIPTHYYQHHDADFDAAVPAEGYGGWKRAELPLHLDKTAVVVMHAWNAGTREQYPGWHRAVEYLPRAAQIQEEVFPSLLGAVRGAGMKLFHVVSPDHYYESYPGYARTLAIAGREEEPRPEQIVMDEVLQELQRFRYRHGFPGDHNRSDIEAGFADLSFLPQSEPQEDEEIAATDRQLYALCRHYDINHLIYVGFAINWCLLLSEGGMAGMSRHGILCSAVRQAVTAVENRETAARELNKEAALWRVSLAFGFVYDAEELIERLSSSPAANGSLPKSNHDEEE
ncbi:hypothetical protein PA598K_04660 [Paenibacillus sp. 598K]|uniref:hypothetical protein n=1 Tax=Paenibacillus sp. 598K TaxID=1117987 RepID=UPI000FFA4805|nr:hypothetical protein [Paenibacillus sp. 598K]GBF76209.1 hypothetical protein PA598K_04660 [Paenibacillus sp. 598K]